MLNVRVVFLLVAGLTSQVLGSVHNSRRGLTEDIMQAMSEVSNLEMTCMTLRDTENRFNSDLYGTLADTALEIARLFHRFEVSFVQIYAYEMQVDGALKNVTSVLGGKIHTSQTLRWTLAEVTQHLSTFQLHSLASDLNTVRSKEAEIYYDLDDVIRVVDLFAKQLQAAVAAVSTGLDDNEKQEVDVWSENAESVINYNKAEIQMRRFELVDHANSVIEALQKIINELPASH